MKFNVIWWYTNERSLSEFRLPKFHEETKSGFHFFYRVPSRACWFNLEGRNSLNDPSSFAKVFIVFAWSSEVVWNFISLVLRIWLHSWSLGITFFTGKWIFKGGVPIHFEHVRILLGWVYVSWPDFLCWALGLHSRKMSTTPPMKQLRCQNTVEWGRCPYF